MTFYFFNAADTMQFVRDDAEQAEHNHQEMSLFALFPYDDRKVITQGLRIGYTDSLGVFQVFEIIKVKDYEPDHYQEINAEHICISELTDEIYTDGDIMDETPSNALSAILSGTLWSVGNVTASNESSVTLSFGDVWSDVRSIEQNWNVYITPRVTFDATGITGRYLDIAPATATWRGLRFSLEKNLDDAAVTWDTSRLKTALYGFGKNSMTVQGNDEKQPWTFGSITWAAEDGHPAKPEGQIYLEDPAATAAYGRDGRARFGYYQNGDVDDPEKLLELTWETLKTVSTPDVTIEGQVRDVTKFGKIDVPIRLHDSAQIEITPIGTLLVREVVQYTEDLLQHENSQLTIGKYIPNIVYITKEIASGGGGGGGSGGDSDEEYKLKEFETDIGWNDYQISLKAWQRDLDKTNENLLLAYAAIGISSSQIDAIVTGSGVELDPETGKIVTDEETGLPVFAAGSSQMWSNIQQNTNRIALVVTQSGGSDVINTASIVAAVNAAGSSVAINADKITLNGQTLVQEISGIEADFTNLTTNQATTYQLNVLSATASTLKGSTILMASGGGYAQLTSGTITVCTGVTAPSICFVGGQTAPSLDHYHDISVSESGGVVSITTGAASATAVTKNFNIAATSFYQNGIAVNAPVWNNASTQDDTNSFTVTSGGGGSVTQNTSLTSTAWSNGSRYVNFNAGGTRRMRITISMPATADSWSYDSITNTVTCTVGGKSYSTTI